MRSRQKGFSFVVAAHVYRQVRNRKVNEAIIQGVETARAVLTTTPQGKAADAQLVKWLMEHQREAGVFSTVSDLVEQLSDNPAARLTAQEIAQRVQQAQQQRSIAPAAG
jgi:TRAP-type C4-dicarboxylate transport system permease large subunit